MRILLPQPTENATDQQLADIAYSWPADRQWTRVNFAMSADGSIRDASKKSAGVSSEDDKRVFMLLRATCDVVLVGAGTARDENYGAVRVREEFAEIRRAQGLSDSVRLAVVTGSANFDPSARMFTESTPDNRPILFTQSQVVDELRGQVGHVAEVIECGDEIVDLPRMMNELAGRGLNRVLSEGGPHFFAAMLEAGVADELCATISPVLVGHDPDDSLTMVPYLMPSHIELTLASMTEANNTVMGCWHIAKRSRG